MTHERTARWNPLRLVPTLALVLLVSLAPAAEAQRTEVLDIVDPLDFDEPEAWALKYFTAVSLLTSLGGVEVREPWSIEVGLELTSVPHLDREQRTVGFGGFKEEDLNRSPVSARTCHSSPRPRESRSTVDQCRPSGIQRTETDRPLNSPSPNTLSTVRAVCPVAGAGPRARHAAAASHPPTRTLFHAYIIRFSVD